MTAFLVVRSGDEAVTVATVEPQDSTAHVVYRPGTRHPSTGELRALRYHAGSAVIGRP